MCVFEELFAEVSCVEAFEKSKLNKNKIATLNCTQNRKTVIELGDWKTSHAKLLNEDSEKDYEKQFDIKLSLS